MPLWMYEGILRIKRTICILVALSYLYIDSGTANNFVSVRVDETAILPCEVVNSDPEPPPHVIEWSRNDHSVPVYMKIGKYPVRVNAHFKGRMSLLPHSASLRIQRVKLSDEGWYVCKVLFLYDYEDVSPLENDETANGTWTKLTVTARPAITKAPPLTVVGREKGRLLLRCRITGKPKPVVSWRKDGWFIKDGEEGYHVNGGELSVTSLTKHHRGNYECRGENSEGHVEYTTSVYIKAPPELTVAPRNLTIKEGLDAFFSCKAAGYPDNITYSWYYNGSDVSAVPSLWRRHSISMDGTFFIYDAKRHDKGRVTCEASNGYGRAPMASAYLIVQYPARVIGMRERIYGGLGLPLTLKCPSEGEPPVSTITWKKEGRVIIEELDHLRIIMTDAGSLTIKKVESIDEGRYSCMPFNALGNDGESNPIRLIVKEPPLFTLRPKKMFEVETGEKLQAFCNGIGDPKPTLSWRKADKVDRQVLDDRVSWRGGNLTIADVSKEDHGLWQCVLSNAVAQITSDVTIYVKYTTPQMVTNVTVSASHDSAVISWMPGYDGGYPQNFIIWFKRADHGDHGWSTRYADGSQTRAIVDHLLPEKVYQFTVLAENALGSGQFSKTITKKMRAKPTPVPAFKRGTVPAPRSLTYTTDEHGIIILSWELPTSLDMKQLLGFLVEYRVSNEDEANDNRKRTKRTVRNTPTKTYNIGRISKRLIQLEPINSLDGQWVELAYYPANATTAAVEPDKLFKSQWYEFHVLAVTAVAYSSPSESVFAFTSKHSSYGTLVMPSKTEEVNAALIAGVVAGTLFVLIVLGAVACYCHRRHGGWRAEFNPAAARSLATNQRQESEISKPLSSLHSSDVSSLTASSSKDDRESAVKRKNNGVLQRIKNKLGFDSEDNHRRPLLLLGRKSKQPECRSSGVVEEHVTPIYRSPDGKFRVRSGSSESRDHMRRNESALARFRVTTESDVIWRKKQEEGRVWRNRPLSDSFIHRDQTSKMSRRERWITYPDKGCIPEEEYDPALEIDCSRCDIQVRYVAQRSSSPAQPHQNALVHSMPPSPSKQMIINHYGRNSPPEHPMISCTSEPALPPETHVSDPYHDRFQAVPTAEYIYLRDLGLPCPGTPSSVISDSRCFSPTVDPMSPVTPTATSPHDIKYHPHSFLPSVRCHMSSRRSFAERPHSTSPNVPNHMLLQHQRQLYLMKLSSNGQYSSRGTVRLHQNKDLIHQTLNRRSAANKTSVVTSKSDVIKRYSFTLPSVEKSDQTEKNNPLISRCLSQPCPENLNRTSQEHGNAYSHPLPNRAFRTQSCSLPSLASRKQFFKQDMRRTSAKRSASEELVGKIDTDSDRRCSFTSGSASTVRYIPSRESDISALGNNSYNKAKAPFTYKQPLTIFSPPTQEEQSPRSNKSSECMSPLFPPSDVGAGSSSGYESQHASSDTSSHVIKSRAVTHSDKSSRSHVNVSLHNAHVHLRMQSRDNFCEHSDQKTNLSTALKENLRECPGVRESTASSNESRSRKDNSSVDDKYEWDSEYAMESEILEALKNFGSHRREKTVSKSLLQELRKLSGEASDSESTATENVLQDSSSVSDRNREACSPQGSAVLSPSEDTSYSKEKMEKRCAALKEEYLQYQRQQSFRSRSLTSPESRC